MTMPYTSHDLKNYYNYTSSGHFFDKDTMRFFNSSLTSHFKRLNNLECLFITSERQGTNPRYYTVRRAIIVNKYEYSDTLKKVNIDTLGEFNTLTLAQAKKLMNSMELVDNKLVEIL